MTDVHEILQQISNILEIMFVLLFSLRRMLAYQQQVQDIGHLFHFSSSLYKCLTFLL